ncbi:hypothetical protein AY599_25540 [Leptolyngbya valderiana BDU 20041]|nr:hypothetical protein AY599_25540 [Leptolyngbya valderiana BDU 20041]
MSSVERWGWLLAWAAVLGIGLWLRFWQIDLQILIDDEWHAVHRLMQASYREIFLSFGHADYTIPLTLWFKFLAETIGLSEWRMRALPLLFGSATIVLLPWIMRPWLNREARWLFAALIAVSPLLIHFTRYVRPYALTVPLGFMAMVALWRWWHEGGRGWLVLFVVGAVACAWLHPLTLLFTGSALLWFLFQALWQIRQHRDWSAFFRIVPVGILVSVLAGLLVLPPLLSDPSAMESKSGIHQIQWATFARAWELIVGSGSAPVAALAAALALIGAWRLLKRDAAFLAYWAFMSLVAVIVIVALEPAWIHHALVLVRYSAVFQPMVLLLIALGTLVLAELLVARLPTRHGEQPRSAPHAALAALLPLGLFFAGPLPEVYRGINQFTSNMRYHIDYKFERSVYTPVMAEAVLPEVYERMAEEPGDWTLIETPWHFESHYSPLSEYQRHHQMPIRIGMMSGLCVDWTFGELEADDDQTIRFDRFVFLNSLLHWRAEENRFVVFHRGTPFGYVRELPDIEPCIDRFREQFGAPWYEDEDQVVFRLPGRSDPSD